MRKISMMLMMSLATLLFVSCKKEQTETTPPSTSLELNVKDQLGNPISGASVKLYTSLTDWQYSSNQTGSTLTTDVNGSVTFNNLSSIQYYWDVIKSCQNNVNGTITTTSPITANQKTVVTVILSSTGDLEITNSSSDNYRIFINGVQEFDIAPSSTENLNYLPIGAYSIRTLQLDGFIFSPTDLTYTGNISCGSILTVNIP